MPSARLTLREEDVVRLALEFLHNRELHISQVSLERETGVINGDYSDDVLFLRQLILDGQWDDALEFVQPLEALTAFDARKFTYSILKHKYIELLCVKGEANVQGSSVDNAVEEVVKVLNELEKYAPTKEDYSTMCLLLTLPRLTDHLQYKDWNPSSARVQCFREVYPLVAEFLPGDKRSPHEGNTCAKNDRLIQLIIKGILYESCVNYCQAKATGTETHSQEMNFSRLLDGTVGFSDSDLSLLSWLQSVPPETFSVPFEQRTLNVDVERLERPSLETSWTEHMLVTPIKPKIFPHSAMPFTRPRSAADIMTRSLMPVLDRVSNDGICNGSGRMMAMSTGDIGANGPMSRSSFASFHLTGIKTTKMMNTSVDRLFDTADGNNSDVFLSNSYVDFQQLPSIREQTSTPKMHQTPSNTPTSNSAQIGAVGGVNSVTRASPERKVSNASTPEHRGRDSPASMGTARSSRRDSLNDRPTNSGPTAMTNSGQNIVIQAPPHPPGVGLSMPMPAMAPTHLVTGAMGRSGSSSDQTVTAADQAGLETSFSGELVKEFQRQKQRLQETLAIKEKEREEMLRQINSCDKFSEGCKQNLNKPTQNGSQVPARNSQSPNPTISVNGTSAGDGFRTPSKIESDHLHSHYDTTKPGSRHSHESGDHGSVHNTSETSGAGSGGSGRPKFVAVTSLEDVQAVRCAEFHPSGRLYAVGSNSKTLRICAYPKMNDLRDDHQTYQPTVLFKRTKHHKGSIYCLAWSPAGDLMATGSNDKTVKLMRFDGDGAVDATGTVEAHDEAELTMHDGTVRDVCFLEDTSNRSSLLISAGAGDCKIYVTDCTTGTPFQALSGHTGHILSLYTWGGAMFASGSHDKTVRFWDLRTRGCVNVVTPVTAPGGGAGAVRQGSPVAGLCVDPSGRLLVSGHEDGACVLYDIRGGRNVQCFRPHASDVRSVRFSPSAYYLLSAGYDCKLVLTDLQGDLTLPLPSVVVAQHQDKVISGRWHPTEFSFLSTSADKTATLWALPPI